MEKYLPDCISTAYNLKWNQFILHISLLFISFSKSIVTILHKGNEV